MLIDIWELDDPWKSPFLVDTLSSGRISLYDKEPEIVYVEREIYNDNQRTGS